MYLIRVIIFLPLIISTIGLPAIMMRESRSGQVVIPNVSNNNITLPNDKFEYDPDQVWDLDLFLSKYNNTKDTPKELESSSDSWSSSLRQIPGLPMLPNIPILSNIIPHNIFDPATWCRDKWAVCVTVLFQSRKCCFGLVCVFNLLCEPIERKKTEDS